MSRKECVELSLRAQQCRETSTQPEVLIEENGGLPLFVCARVARPARAAGEGGGGVVTGGG